MPTDLSQVNDHPAKILADRAAQFGDMSLHDAAELLYKYERSEGVVFAALDKNGLDILLHAYSMHTDNPHHYRCGDVIDAVRDLFGLGD